MEVLRSLPLCIFLLVASFLFTYSEAANFTIQNNCDYTVWAASSPVGGGIQLDPGQGWYLSFPSGTPGRIWARTNCSFDTTGRGKCETGDCNGTLQCKGYGTPPNTLAEFAINVAGNLDFFDLSLVDGFNVPMDFSPVINLAPNGCNLVEYSGNEYIGQNFYISLDNSNNNSNNRCRGIRCAGDIKGECPVELRAPGGCQNPCSVFEKSVYCCTNVTTCQATYLSSFFKEKCPDAYSYSFDDQTSTFTCPGGTNYRVTFCP